MCSSMISGHYKIENISDKYIGLSMQAMLDISILYRNNLMLKTMTIAMHEFDLV